MLQEVIETKLQEHFEPEFLNVLNESYMHNVPAGSESHFKVVVVSDKFEGQRLIGRHRQVNQVLADELANHILLCRCTHTRYRSGKSRTSWLQIAQCV